METSKPRLLCRQQNNHGYTCWDPAKFVAYFFTDGSGVQLSCKQHLAKAVAVVLVESKAGGGTRTVKVTAL